MELVDTHCHLLDPPMGADPTAVLARARALGVSEVWVPGVDLETSARALERCAALPGARVAVGLHPQAVRADSGWLEHELSGLEALLARGRAVAVGEIGLDAEVENPMQAQERALREQLALARRHGRIALVHCRGAFARLLAMLEEAGADRPGVVLHAWAGSPEITGRLVELGCSFGVAGVVTRKQATRARARLAAIPLGRMLLETDAPYIGTASRPKGQVEPVAVEEICRTVAELLDLPAEAVAEATTRNARALRGDA